MHKVGDFVHCSASNLLLVAALEVPKSNTGEGVLVLLLVLRFCSTLDLNWQALRSLLEVWWWSMACPKFHPGGRPSGWLVNSSCAHLWLVALL